MGEAKKRKRKDPYFGDPLAWLNAAETDELSYELIRSYIHRMVAGYLFPTVLCPIKQLFRARVNPKSKDGMPVRFTHYRELWHKDAMKVNEFGRFNKPYEPILYCSHDGKTAVNEIRPSLNEHITILTIGLKEPSFKLNLSEIGLSEIDQQRNVNGGSIKIQNEFIKVTRHLLAKSPSSLPHDVKLKSIIQIRSYLAEQCLKPGSQSNLGVYKKTSAIGEILLSYEGVHGVIYPSIANLNYGYHDGQNIAIKPSVAATNLQPVSCIECRVIGESNGYKILEPTSGVSLIDDEGKIEWNSNLTDTPKDWICVKPPGAPVNGHFLDFKAHPITSQT